MAFSESVKRKVRRRSHMRCCLCHELGVEVHHITAQAENGGDSEGNAAPLCPSCHEKYGANPTKRKFIREVRDFWYERCSEQETGNRALSEVQATLSKVATKNDIQALGEEIRQLLGNPGGEGQTLPKPPPESGKTVAGVEIEIVERALEVLSKLFPVADKATYYLEIKSDFEVVHIGMANQRDALSHLVTLLTEDLNYDDRCAQIRHMEEHLRRSVTMPYAQVVMVRATRIIEKLKSYKERSERVVGRPELGGDLDPDSIQNELRDILHLRASGLEGAQDAESHEMWSQRAMDLVTAYNRIEALESRVAEALEMINHL